MNMGYLRRRRKRRRLPCWLMRLGIESLRMCRARQGRSEARCWGKFPMFDCRIFGFSNFRIGRQRRLIATMLLAVMVCAGCAKKPDPGTVVMLIESSPTNLDPRIGTDAQSERIDKLIFDALV